MYGSYIVSCPACGARNRVPADRWGDERAVCGRCRARLRPSALYPDRPVPVSDAAFGREVLAFEGPVVVEFFSPRCGHCVRLAPVIEELASRYAGRVKFATIDIDRDRLVASREGVSGTPTLFFYNRGRLVDKVVGALPERELAGHVERLAA